VQGPGTMHALSATSHGRTATPKYSLLRMHIIVNQLVAHGRNKGGGMLVNGVVTARSASAVINLDQRKK